MSKQTRNYRKFVATAATATLVATAIVPVASADETPAHNFTDVAGNYDKPVSYLYSKDIFRGLSETQFGTQNNIKRVDVAVMLANAILTEEEIANAPASGFSDVPSRAEKHLGALKVKGIVSGKTKTSFGAQDSITRGEAALMLAKAYDITGDEENVEYSDVALRYKEAVAALVDNDITKGKGNNKFGTTDAIKRGELAIFLYKLETLDVKDEELVVESVEAIATTIDKNAEENTLTFTVNGEKVSLEALEEAGYEAEFQATVTDIFEDTATGKLDNEKIQELTEDTFQYKVVLSKDNETIESGLATVKVEDFESVVASLDEYTLTSNDIALTNNVLVAGEEGAISEVKGKSKSGKEVKFENDKLTFSSSDDSILLVNSAGEIVPVAKGEAKVIVTVKDTDVKLEIPVKIETEARTADKVTATTDKIGLVAGNKQEFFLAVTDQYGNPYPEFEHANVAVKNADEEEIANVSVEAEEANKGIYKATVTAIENAGEGTLEIKVNDETASSIAIDISDDKEVAERKLKLKDALTDGKLDLNLLKDNQSTQYVVNQYNADGYFIGVDTKAYTVEANNDNVKVSSNTGVITVEAQKAGTSVVTVKEGTVTVDKVTVTVEDTSPVIEEVTFPGKTLEQSPAELSEVFSTEEVTLTSSDNVSIAFEDGKGILYVEGSEAEGYQEGEDVFLGTVELVSADIQQVSISDDGLIQSAGEDLAKDQKGKITLRVNANDKVIATNTITVDIKEVVDENTTPENSNQ